MGTLKIYEVVVDDGTDVFKTSICATSKRELKDKWAGNGEFLKITDVTDKYPISVEKVEDALENAGFNRGEVMLITEILSRGLA